MRRAGRGLPRIGCLALLALGLAVPPASATFHEMSIREIYPGSVADPGSEYVELQMWASGQEFVKGHTVRYYDAAGASVGTAPFLADVANGANQSTILIATGQAELAFGVSADLAMDPGLLDPAGGAVCWEGLDCVSWGAFAGPLPSAAGPPATPGGIPDGMALRRSIARSCASLFEGSDDRDDSAGDFEAVFPSPRPNSAAPSEKACAGGGGDGGKGGGDGAPQTTLKRKPAKRTADRTPTFRFSSDEDRVSFQCKLDGGKFRSCRSPFTTRRLALGPHTFRVRAKDSSGQFDRSPAKYSFRVVAGKG